MKRLYLNITVFLLFVLLLFCVLAMITNNLARAEPFLRAGATPNATRWEINLDGVIIDAPVSHIIDGTAWLEYDLEGISFGDHFVEVRACNNWVCSAWFPLAFTKDGVDVLINPYIDI